jgi:hypothetical protein
VKNPVMRSKTGKKKQVMEEASKIVAYSSRR